ncbi:MAG: ATP-binding protein [Peptococcaceae bacterium]|nr:ATP-binding protein [Peptococcaceae bacterium]
MDRIDIVINVPRLSYEELKENSAVESSEIVKERVERARKKQIDRCRETGSRCNAYISSEKIQDRCKLSKDAESLLKSSFKQFKMSARSHYKVLKITQTIADLCDSDTLEIEHLAEALQYRRQDKLC